MLQDIAILTNGTVISDELGLELKDVTMDQLGRAKSVKVQKESTVIVDGEGNKEDINARIAQIKHQITETTSEFDKEKLQERLAKLAGGVAVIRVGAATETEMKEAKLRMEDALNATRAAVEEGIIAGGGSAYIHASKEVEKLIAGLDGDEKTGAKVVLKALESPLYHIAANAGLEGSVIINKVKESETGVGFDALNEKYVDMVKEGILDPTKVTRSALQNATSVAGTLLTTEAVVSNIKEETPAMPAGGAPGGKHERRVLRAAREKGADDEGEGNQGTGYRIDRTGCSCRYFIYTDCLGCSCGSGSGCLFSAAEPGSGI